MSADAAVAAITAQENAPETIVVGVLRDGVADLATSVPGAERRRFDLASVSKVAATTTLLQTLVADGALDLDAPVRSVLPDMPHVTSSMRSLLHHRAGLWEWQPLYLASRPAREAVATLPLRYAPNTQRHYSDLGFMMLGWIVEAIAGSSLDDAYADLITGPLALECTGYGPIAPADAITSALGDAAERRMVATADPYPVLFSDAGFPWRETPVRGDVNDGNCRYAFGGVAGHAGVFSTARDLLALGRALSVGADPLGGPAAEAFHAPGPDAEQALGWRTEDVTISGRPCQLLWHPGFTGTALGFVPGEDLAITMLTDRLLTDRPIPTVDLWSLALRAVPELSREDDPYAV